MSLLNCFIVLLASCLFCLAIVGYSRELRSIEQVGFRGEPFEQTSTEELEEWFPTEYKINKYSYLWTIANFSLRQEESGEFISSPVFSNDDLLTWTLNLYPNGYDDDSLGKISLFIQDEYITPFRGNTLIMYKFSILDQNGNFRNFRGNGRPKGFEPNKGWGIDSYISRHHLLDPEKGLLHDDKLSIVCEFDVLEQSEIDSSQLYGQFESPTDELATQLEVLYESREFGDLIISIRGTQFKAHRAVLSARSPVFRQMLDGDSDESQVNRLELADIQPNVFQELLRFIYSGKISMAAINNNDESFNPKQCQELVSGLWEASKKYQLDGLGPICEQVLIREISVHSASELLLLAYSNNRPQLKNQVIEFIRNNYRLVFLTSGWISTFKEAPTELIAELNGAIFN